MICNDHSTGSITNRPPMDVMAVRRSARVVLRQLLIDRAFTEQRLSEAGRIDPIKTLTGDSALDQAIASTREMIRRLDHRLPMAARSRRRTGPTPMVAIARGCPQLPSLRVGT